MWMDRQELVALIVFICLSVAGTAATAGPLLVEDWESGTNNGWGINEFWGLDVTLLNGEGFNGSQGVLKLNIPQDEDDSEWGNKSFPAQEGPVYFRFYVRWSDNWQWSPIENKIMYLNWPGDDQWRACVSRQAWLSSIKNRRYDPDGTEYYPKPGELEINVLYDGLPARRAYLQNVGSFATAPYCVQPGQWYCIEWMVHPNTPGLANGALKMWINQTLVLHHENVDVRGTKQTGVRRVTFSSYWNQVNFTTPHPYFNVWYDDFQVDTQYIGPVGPDTIPPSAQISVSE